MKIYIVQRRVRFTGYWETMPEFRAYQHRSNADMDCARLSAACDQRFDFRVVEFVVMDQEVAA